ncbi:MAG TPA: alpha/beta fold hydrolase [Gaiellaceae bacterium]|nr:alpha/beta fold hydrolase [Gaiellaceae bacterium]
MSVAAPAREQSRARYPDEEGFVERDGVRVFYEVYGDAPTTFLLFPTSPISHSRLWKGQIPYLSRSFRVIVFDPRGNGKSDRPDDAEAYSYWEVMKDGRAVLEATGTETALLGGLCDGGGYALMLAASDPALALGVAAISPCVPGLTPGHPNYRRYPSTEPLDTDEGWAKWNVHYWRRDFRGFLEFFFSQQLPEPHSTKQIEDCVRWGLDGGVESLVLADEEAPPPFASAEEARDLVARVRCPVLVVHGELDNCQTRERALAVAELTGGTFVALEGAGHIPTARHPVKVNGLLKEFADEVVPPAPKTRTWTRALSRRRRALYVSSPIGLGHARRDVAIAKELRNLHPDLEIDWLAQHPVTAVLEAEGERIHPASALLANESTHIESESAEHDLHAFQAIRRMDEILVANFMLFLDVVREEPYDIWIGDEAWEVDYFLHENPELKSSAYVWLTDFVGWLPMEDGDEREAFLTTDYNAEMIEHIARFPRIRDRAVFVGNPDDVVPDSFGAELPGIRDWTEQHYDFAGYVTGFEPVTDREKLRHELGYRPGEQVCIVTVGGSGVGAHLLRRVIAAFPEAKRHVPHLRMVVVAGPRIDPASLQQHDGLEVRAYVHELYRHLAACDLAVVQGGLTTAMELTANRRPFLYFPLRHHFEQNFHVRHRLERYGAGRRMDFETDGPGEIAAAIAEEIGREVDYRPVETDGAARAAKLIAELL